MAGALDVVGLIWSSAPVVGPVLRIKPAASPPTRFGALSLRHLRHAREVRPTPRRSLSLLPLLAARVDCERPHASPSRILSLPCSSTTTPLPSSPPPCQPGHSPSPASLHRRTPRGVCGPVFVPCRKKSRTGRCEGRRPAASSVARPPPRRRETTMAARCPSATGQGPAGSEKVPPWPRSPRASTVRRRGAANRWLGVPAHRDVVDYICFRAVCFGWRACTPAPRDPNLRDPRLRPRGWVALYDGDAVRPDDACEIVFFHTRTARRLRVPLPELRGHRIAGFTDGLVILMHKLTTAVRVLQPFTRDVVDFQPLATLYHQVVRHKASLLDMNAAVCSSASSADSIAVVVWFPYTNVVLAADPGSSDWEVLHSGLYVGCALPFQGRLYATLSCSSEIVQLYPPRQNGPLENHVVIADAPHSAHVNLCNFYLVESGGRMLLAVRQPARYANGSEWNALDWSRRVVCRLYVIVDLNSQRCKLIPVKSIGDRALFLCGDRCLSVSASDLPSLSSNSVYSTLPQYPILVLSLATGLSERLAGSCQIHDGKERIRPSVRPFTIADHLITYCNPREWSKGLMFHEYHYIPQSFEELIKKIRAQARELRIPRIAVHSR